MRLVNVKTHDLLSEARAVTAIIATVIIAACGGNPATPSATSSTVPMPTTPAPTIPEPTIPTPTPPAQRVPITQKPSNNITHAYFLDQDSDNSMIAGEVIIDTLAIKANAENKAQSLWVYWANEQGEKQGDAWLKTNEDNVYQLTIPDNTEVLEQRSAFIIYPTNNIGQSTNGTLITFHDFSANSELSGLGGNEKQQWQYGEQRPKISIKRDAHTGLCIFDNGLVSVINMKNTKQLNAVGSLLPQANHIDDNAYPAYSFLCGQPPVHNADHISDEIGTWTYSSLNDAMYYGTIAHNTFVKHLAEPPLASKIRLRVHYGNLIDDNAFWDGAYANFTDAYPYFYSTTSLDIITHEIAHGVLNRISPLNIFEQNISLDAKTIHEAFSDISGVMAKYELTGQSNNWVHGLESHGPTRKLNQIMTEPGASASYLDYNPTEKNYYLRIGLITYPFYLLANKWGLSATYQLFIHASKNCWPATVTLPQAAQCLQQQAELMALSNEDVVNAFKAVKIKLFEEGVLSHFTKEQYKLRTVFTDNSQSTGDIIQWHWNFGDGNSSNEQSPEHHYNQAGNYQVVLTVTDNTNGQHSHDSFNRELVVSDKYCPITAKQTDNKITAVTINSSDIHFNNSQADYSQTAIELGTDFKLAINIQGDTQATVKSTSWKVWIDLNDNGIFGDSIQELVFNDVTEKSQPYQLNTVIDLSTLPTNGIAKYIRISGDYSVTTTPCASGIGEAFDLRIKW